MTAGDLLTYLPDINPIDQTKMVSAERNMPAEGNAFLPEIKRILTDIFGKYFN